MANITTKQDQATVAKILSIRAKAGNHCTTCPTCTKEKGSGFRTCVDACHMASEGNITNERGSWLNRPQARQVRKMELDRIARFI